MVLSLSKGAKNILDTGLAFAGLILGQLTTGALRLPAPYDVIAPVIGTIGGYLVSDAISVVDTGQAPAPAVVVSQLSASYALARPLAVTEIAKLPADQQGKFNLALTVLDELAAQAK